MSFTTSMRKEHVIYYQSSFGSLGETHEISRTVECFKMTCKCADCNWQDFSLRKKLKTLNDKQCLAVLLLLNIVYYNSLFYYTKSLRDEENSQHKIDVSTIYNIHLSTSTSIRLCANNRRLHGVSSQNREMQSTQ